jgi:hypothetical protein
MNSAGAAVYTDVTLRITDSRPTMTTPAHANRLLFVNLPADIERRAPR